MSLNDGQPKQVAVVGAGICGSLTAWFAQQLGFDVHIFEPDTHKQSCSFTAAGMLAPMAELESADLTIYEFGKRSISLWPSIIQKLGGNIFHRDNGTLVVSHRQDEGSFYQFVNCLKAKLGGDGHGDFDKGHDRESGFDQQWELLASQTIEPELKDLGTSLLLKGEAQVDAHQALNALHGFLKENGTWHSTQANTIEEKNVNGETFDWVFDCRGLGAAQDVKGLHGVRGEVIMVQAPQVNIQRMVRVMHPRYRIYIVPREDHKYMIGATEIQSDDTGPISVRSTLELLSAAFSVHSGFAEARILALDTNARPATLDHQPIIQHENGLTRINGLYRHGYLLAPSVVEQAFSELGLTLPEFKNKPVKQSQKGAEYADCI